MKKLATNIKRQFQKASEAFKAFDLGQSGKISFSDFMTGIIDLKLAGSNFTKEIILQIFTFFDLDKDNYLRYADFCNLFSKAGEIETTFTAVQDPFMSMLRKIKNKKPARISSAIPRIDNKFVKPLNAFDLVKNIEDVTENDGRSMELTRYMARSKEWQKGHSVHAPEGSTLDFRDAQDKIGPNDSVSRAGLNV